MRRKRAGLARALLPVLLVGAVAACGESADKRRTEERSQRMAVARQNEEKIQGFVSELASPYGADLTWNVKAFIWTADVRERLIRPDKRPIAGVAKFVDIERDGAAYRLHLRHGDFLNPSLDLLLKTTRREVPPSGDWSLVSEEAGSLLGSAYVFVASIDRVRRDDVQRGGETHRRWIAEGECLDIRPPPEPSRPAGTESAGRRR
jgi:hypothetical protein